MRAACCCSTSWLLKMVSLHEGTKLKRPLQDKGEDAMGKTRNVFAEPAGLPVIRTEDVYHIAEMEDGVTGYSDKLLSIVATFSNNGAPEGFNAQSMVGKSKRGEVALRLFAVIDPETERFVRVGFKARGCLAMTACASAICTMLEGLSFDEALAITPDDVKHAVDGVPWDKIHTLYFATCGVRALIGDYRMKQGVSRTQLDECVSCDVSSFDCIMGEHCSLRDTRIELMIKEAGTSQTSIADSLYAHEDDVVQAEATMQTHAAPVDVQTFANTMPAEAETPTAIRVPTDSDTITEADVDTFVKAEAEAIPDTVDSIEADESIEYEQRMRAVVENNALATVFDDVREQSRASRLVESERWIQQGFIPEHMDAAAFEELVYRYLEEHGAVKQSTATNNEAHIKLDRAAQVAAANERARSRSLWQARSATRTVGVPVFERNREAEKDGAAREAARVEEARQRAQRAEDAKRAAQEAAAQEASFNPDTEDPESPFASLKLPEGYRLAYIEGEYVLVPDTDNDGIPVARTIHCENVAMLKGERSRYLYDRTVMTDAYAHWAFLAAEDNPLVTFTDCVREDSRIYPRPLAADSLKNPPFCMTDDDIEAVWEAVRSLDEYRDIERTVASNGEVFFYSTKYLSPRLAQARAEWNAVGRVLNV